MAKKTPKWIKAHCPTCDGERNCNVHGTLYKAWDWEDKYSGNFVSGGADYSLLECRGCEVVFHHVSSWNSEDMVHWHDDMGVEHYDNPKDIITYPRPDAKTKPVWFDAMQKVDPPLHNILRQMYVAYDNDANILTAIALRTALDRGTEILGIDAAKTFDEKLDELRDDGWIGQTERDILGVVTDAGNAAAHRGWDPDSREVSDLLSSIEVFLHRAFIVGGKALTIKSRIPSKPARKKMPKASQKKPGSKASSASPSPKATP